MEDRAHGILTAFGIVGLAVLVVGLRARVVVVVRLQRRAIVVSHVAERR